MSDHQPTNQPARDEGWIATASGRRVYFGERRRENRYSIEDIAHGLAHICRFAGQCPTFYSVAQHSVLVAEQVMERTGEAWLAKAAMLHDAAEAYMADIPRPLKLMLPGYKALEKALAASIFRQFRLAYPFANIIQAVDNAILATEAREFGMADRGDWDVPDAIDGIEIEPWGPDEAKASFLDEWQFYCDRAAGLMVPRVYQAASNDGGDDAC